MNAKTRAAMLIPTAVGHVYQSRLSASLIPRATSHVMGDSGICGGILIKIPKIASQTRKILDQVLVKAQN